MLYELIDAGHDQYFASFINTFRVKLEEHGISESKILEQIGKDMQILLQMGYIELGFLDMENGKMRLSPAEANASYFPVTPILTWNKEEGLWMLANEAPNSKEALCVIINKKGKEYFDSIADGDWHTRPLM